MSEDLENLKVIFEDDVLLAVLKPHGIPSQSTPDLKRASMESLASTHTSPLWLVHRLDADTSGVLVFAKTKEAAAILGQSLAAHTWTKVYWAIVQRSFESEINSGPENRGPGAKWTVDNHLKQTKRKLGKRNVSINVAVRSGGDRAITDFQVLTSGTRSGTRGGTDDKSGTWLIEARPRTGRMHQIRVHLADIGLPIVGDRIYGEAFYRDRSAARGPYEQFEPNESDGKSGHATLALHARALRLPHPSHSEQWVELLADPQPEFLATARQLGLALDPLLKKED